MHSFIVHCAIFSIENAWIAAIAWPDLKQSIVYILQLSGRYRMPMSSVSNLLFKHYLHNEFFVRISPQLNLNLDSEKYIFTSTSL